MPVIPKAAVLHRDTAAPPQPSDVTTVAPQPVLITERQVKFATVTALSAPRPVSAPHRWLSALRLRLVQRAGAERQPRRHYPPRRLSYFENAATAREMDRL
ncbi:hypothetical protein [Mycobacterium triplex]|nr:hypothetical protein [Mycobacterium triplex]CDO86101.1 hypothetical protein BN973_00442 [Mycobacterium triplex]